ncbi:MAG: 3-phosphoglycerate dehydrogenase [Dysgonamonadaceae bacterium]|jgi:D-3-phosphoglycerate dehydrogenase|nr:3-phosphoglycerate dehydrogenase [Dysgonamonadaceae bacterium]
MKVLIATSKPFAIEAVRGIKEIIDNAGFELSVLEKYADKSQLLDAVKDADALIVRSDPVDSAVMEAAGNLKIVVRAGAGYDNINLDIATARNIVVMNTPGQNAAAVAELALGLMLIAGRNFYDGSMGIEMFHKTLGLHGFGNVARRLASLVRGCAMDIYAYDPYYPAEDFKKIQGVIAAQSLEELYENCQYVSVHIPATDETKNIINYDLLKRMPHNAILVNTARKEVVDEAGLVKWMEERPDVKYLTDVATSNDTELRAKFTNRYFSTPKKMGAQTVEANNNAGIAAANQIVDFLLNGNTKFQVNG